MLYLRSTDAIRRVSHEESILIVIDQALYRQKRWMETE
jgi:hypothetical protein